MRVTAFQKFGAPEVLSSFEMARPRAAAGEVVIRVAFTSVNPIDCKIRRGNFRLLTRTRPRIVGFDVSGVVDEVGPNVSEFKPGDEVCCLMDFWNNGGNAEYVRMKAKHVWSKPPTLSLEQAAALPLAGLTANDGIRTDGKTKPHDRVLILGASGGVGSYAVQIAKVVGAHVTAVCSARNADYVRDLGADEVLPYDQASLPSDARFDMVFDVVGTSSFLQARSHLTKAGRYIATVPSIITVAALVLIPLLALFGYRRRITFLMKPARSGFAYLSSLVQQGQLEPHVDRVYSMEHLADAHRYSESARVRGKLVIRVSEPNGSVQANA